LWVLGDASCVGISSQKKMISETEEMSAALFFF